ncbi:hypothetical protein GCM10010383_64620 [Streptomyces lomondensis]|uniref:Uncharacterized protein n=1 Tax=Streptomyces lomondensis TaxID=68229 RepID=A0ABQ2XMP5_9ACTN|nr:hypothetical protein GCM10010383_64620 [Streptomyces lomondensis]
MAAEFPTSDLPPIETAYWLIKPRSLVRGTWEEAKEAAAWLGERLAEHAHRFASSHDRDTTRLVALVNSAARCPKSAVLAGDWEQARSPDPIGSVGASHRVVTAGCGP